MSVSPGDLNLPLCPSVGSIPEALRGILVWKIPLSFCN